MENVRDDLLQAQAELKSFEDQREEEREEIQRGALHSQEYFEKMIANQAVQTLGKLATLKVCCYMLVLTPLVDWPLKRQNDDTSKVE